MEPSAFARASRSAICAADETAGVAEVAALAGAELAAFVAVARADDVGVPEAAADGVPLDAGADGVPPGCEFRLVQPSTAPTRAAAPASRRNSRRSMAGFLKVWGLASSVGPMG